jgi:uncharacterized membrane protein YhhN
VIWILLTTAATAALLAADRSGNKRAIRLFKPLASAGFVGLACSSAPLDNPYGAAILAALALSFVGDLCLLSARVRWFLAGLVAFALAHVAYIVAFARFAPSTTHVLVLVAVLALPALFVHRWLLPHVERAMRVPVQTYMAIITAMVAFAAAAVLVGAPPGVLVGAALFYASDLAVARDRFVAPGFGNRAWGLPTYYAAQLVLASTVG